MYQQNKNLYTFEKTYELVQLERICNQETIKSVKVSTLPDRFMLAVIRRDLTMLEVDLQSKSVKELMRSIIGEATLHSLIHRLFPGDDSDKLIDQAFSAGQFSHTDLLVEDIYGNNTQTVGLKGKIIASSLGKIFKMGQQT